MNWLWLEQQAGVAAFLAALVGIALWNRRLLGRPGGIKHVFKHGRRIDIETPLPTRTSLPSWRVSTYSDIPATRWATLGWKDD